MGNSPASSATRRTSHQFGAAMLTGLLGLALAAPATAAPAQLPTQEAPPPNAEGDEGDVAVDSEVTASVETEGKADFWIYFEDQADLSPAYGIGDWTERGQFVVDTLQRAADTSQAHVRAELEAQGATFTPYWVANAIKVESGSASTLKELGDFSEIASIEADHTYALPEPVESEPDPHTAGGPVGGVTVADEDLLTLLTDDSAALAFDGSDVGLAGFTLDAAARLNDGSWAFSFTNAGAVPGVTGAVDDSDLVRFVPTSLGDTTAGTFSMWFDASDLSLNTDSEDVDAVDVQADGSIVFSTSGSFLTSSGLSGRDVDLVRFVPTSLGSNTAGAVSILFDGRDVELDVASEDVDALVIAGDGSLAFSSVGALSVTGLTATAGDLTRFVPTQLGTTTTGTWDPALVITGAAFGITDVTAFELP